VNGSSQTVTGTAYYETSNNCHVSTLSCTGVGGAGGRGAGWYADGVFYETTVQGGGGTSCQVGNIAMGECNGGDGRSYASGGSGTNGGSFGTAAFPSGGAGGVAFNAYRLVAFVHAGLWSGRVIDEASPAPDDDNTEPVEDADYLLTISSHAQNYSVLAELSAAGWDGVTPTSVKVVVEQDIVVGGSSTSSYAISFAGLPEGSTAILVNNGDIIGRYGAVSGGAGGHAVKTEVPLKLYNYGKIFAGGGGGVTAGNVTVYGVASHRRGNGDCFDDYGAWCRANGGIGGRGAGWYSNGLYYSSPVNGTGGSSCTAGGTSDGCPNARVARATSGAGTSGGGLGFEADVGGAAGYAFSGFNLIDFVVPGEWGGRIANN
ncbi:MAG: hypothetical protein RLO14_13900, partial [Marinobacter salarius]